MWPNWCAYTCGYADTWGYMQMCADTTIVQREQHQFVTAHMHTTSVTSVLLFAQQYMVCICFNCFGVACGYALARL